MTNKELKEWLRENSAGYYRPAAEAADRIEQLEKALKWYVENDDSEEDGGFYDQGRKRAEEALR